MKKVIGNLLFGVCALLAVIAIAAIVLLVNMELLFPAYLLVGDRFPQLSPLVPIVCIFSLCSSFYVFDWALEIMYGPLPSPSPKKQVRRKLDEC